MPNILTVYAYDRQTGEYLGTALADESPLEPGKFLLPAHCTTEAPPPAEDGKVRCWSAGHWQQFADWRGQPVFDTQTGARVHIDTIGALPARCTPLERPSHLYDWTGAGWELNEARARAHTIAQFSAAIQARLDAFARLRGYDSMLSCCSYAGSQVPAFAAEAARCLQLRDATWSAANAILAEIDAGTRMQPAVDDVLAELPALEWQP